MRAASMVGQEDVLSVEQLSAMARTELVELATCFYNNSSNQQRVQALTTSTAISPGTTAASHCFPHHQLW
jgi:hypothetical protein